MMQCTKQNTNTMQTWHPLSITAVILIIITSCEMPQGNIVTSPNGQILLGFSLSEQGHPQYFVKHNNSTIIDTSGLGFEFRDIKPLDDGFSIKNIESSSTDKYWEPVWGEQNEIHNQFNELLVELEEDDSPNRVINLRFRLFNDGLGFRTEFPSQDALTDSIVIMDEHTEFALTGDHQAHHRKHQRIHRL